MRNLGKAMAGGASGRSARTLAQKHDGFYPTPYTATLALLKWWNLPLGPIWEPAAGEGHICRVLEAMGYPAIGSDLRDRGCPAVTPGRDFLAFRGMPPATRLITNPPFNGDLPERFIQQSAALGIADCAMLVKSTYWSAVGRYPVWQRHQPSYELVLTWRLDFLEQGAPVMEASWLIWTEAQRGPCQKALLLRPTVAEMDDLASRIARTQAAEGFFPLQA